MPTRAARTGDSSLGVDAAVTVIYVSYDGALDPLGSSQVVPYLIGLADRGVAITLVSFEKIERWSQLGQRARMRERLEAHRIRWRPVFYHRRPRLAATLWDIVVGSRVIASEVQRRVRVIVHCRGDIAMAMARRARPHPSTRLLYDLRGFFSDERVETGSWKRGSLLDRAVRRVEAANLQRADGAVVLTRHAAEELHRRRPSLRALEVIPTCADVSAFRPRGPGRKPDFGLVYSGSLGTWYMSAEMVAFARSAAESLPGRTLFLTPQPEEVRRLGATVDWAEVLTLEPGDVAEWLRRASALFFFIKPIPSKRASCPTKFAEGLAAGLPVVCNRGIGDLDTVVEGEGVGILVDGFSESAYAVAAQRLGRLLEDPGLSERCRRLAEARYGVDRGVDSYHKLYVELVADSSAKGGHRGSSA